MTLIAAAAAITAVEKRCRQRDGYRGKLWCRQWSLARSSERELQHFMLNELSVSDVIRFHSLARMTSESNYEQVRLVESLVSGNDTMKDCVAACDKLVVTLHYLSSGTSC